VAGVVKAPAPRLASLVALGVALGFVLSRLGFTDFGEVHRMFTLGLERGGPRLADLRLMLAFCGAVALAGAWFFLLARRDGVPARRVHRGTIVGGVLFGAGWALAGGCPSIAIVQLGEGRALAALTASGILAGTWAGRRLAARLRWEPGGCAD
jgi:uncharacterized membrane protein YedE/YeeE